MPDVKMNIYQKLLEMQKRVDKVVKDGKNSSDKYDFASDENVLDTFRPLMDELGLLLIPAVGDVRLYGDLRRRGGVRAEEYATHLREQRIGF